MEHRDGPPLRECGNYHSNPRCNPTIAHIRHLPVDPFAEGLVASNKETSKKITKDGESQEEQPLGVERDEDLAIR